MVTTVEWARRCNLANQLGLNLHSLRGLGLFYLSSEQEKLPALKRALKDFHMDVVSTALEANAFTGLDAAQDPAERAMLGEIAAEGGFRTPPRD